MNGQIFCLGVAHTGKVKALTYEQLQNAEVITQHLLTTNGVIPHYKCKMYCTIECEILSINFNNFEVCSH